MMSIRTARAILFAGSLLLLSHSANQGPRNDRIDSRPDENSLAGGGPHGSPPIGLVPIAAYTTPFWQVLAAHR